MPTVKRQNIKTIFYKLIPFFLIFALFSAKENFAQSSIYHSIIFPYDLRGSVTQTMGGISAAQPDFISGAQINPGGLSFFNKGRLFLGMAQKFIRIKQKPLQSQDSFSKDLSMIPAQFSASIPFKMIGRQNTVSISANKIDSPEYEVLENISENSFADFYERNGSVWKTDLGISSQLFKNLGVGLSWTKWFGTWRWNDETQPNRINNQEEYLYNGSSFTLGVMKRWKKTSIGLALYSPFTLMKTKTTYLPWEGFESKFRISQKFKGGGRVGVVFQFNPQFKIGAGYRYQDKILIEALDENDYLIQNYSGKSHQVSLALEFSLLLKRMHIPLFVSYQITKIPDIEGDTFIYQTYSFQNKEKFIHGFTAGLKFNYRPLTFYLTNQLYFSHVQVKADTQIIPPYS
jgi:hypothetical protein